MGLVVVLDSNIWLAELALNSGLGSAVRFFLRQQGARLAVPEVVRLEVEAHARAQLNGLVKELGDSHRKLLTLLGSLKELVLPERAVIDRKVAGIIGSAGVDVIDVPFTLESAHASFLKTIRKQPPSDKNQQFKDGVVWADCVQVLDSDDVVLVTSDTAFYRDRDVAKGLGFVRRLASC